MCENPTAPNDIDCFLKVNYKIFLKVNYKIFISETKKLYKPSIILFEFNNLLGFFLMSQSKLQGQSTFPNLSKYDKSSSSKMYLSLLV